MFIRPHRLSPLMSSLILALSLASPALGQVVERWYVLEMSGARAGYSHSTQKTEDERITTDTDMVFALKRGAAEIKISMGSSIVETAKGAFVSMRSLQKLGAMDVEQTFVFREKDVEVTTVQAGASRTTNQPLPEGAYLPPAAAEAFLKQRLASEAKKITVVSLDPTTGLTPITATYTNFESVKVLSQGREIETTKMRVEASNAPGMPSHQYVDAEGVVVRVETQIGGMSITMNLASEAEAKATGGPAPELMVSTFVKPSRPIENARASTHAVYRLSMSEGELPEIPTTGSQQPGEKNEQGLSLEIHAVAAYAAPEADRVNRAFVAATTTADAENPRIRELAAKAVTDAGDAKPARAEALRRFAHAYIKRKNLDVGFATASEVAQTRQGDCSEHGVFLAALLRADGIPSRVVAGLIYADAFAGSERIFGYHMWTQALLEIDGEQRWVDLDATLGKDTPFDATHIALATSDLADGESTTALARMATVLGRLQIEVVSVK